MKKMPVAYPLLFALWPVLGLYSACIVQVSFSAASRAAVFAVALALTLMIVFRLVAKDYDRAGLITLTAEFLFIAYGSTYPGISALAERIGATVHHALLLGLWIGLFFWTMHYLVTTPRQIGKTRSLLNLMTLALVAMPLYSIGQAEYQLARTCHQELQVQLPSEPGSYSVREAKPDIYYIILDGYGRADVLEEIYGYDNRDLRDFLQSQGFFLAQRSRSNYGLTVLSLASSLNMTYLDFLAEEMGSDSSDRIPLIRLIQKSVIRRFLESQGYSVIAFPSAWRATDWTDATYYWEPPDRSMTIFESAVLRSPGLFTLENLSPVVSPCLAETTCRGHRSRIRFALDHLPDATRVAGPKFVFAHVACPHPPFVLEADGQPRTPGYYCTLTDGAHLANFGEDYIGGYRAQVAYLDRIIPSVISRILDASETPPVIIIQGDHGPRSRRVWHSIQETDLREGFSILNAYYLPNTASPLYDTVTPVNSFRVVLNEYFGASLAMLPDESWVSVSGHPYTFVPVPAAQ